MTKKALKTLLEGTVWKEIVYLKETTSTNDIAVKLAEEGAPHGTVVIAGKQTTGRGRLGRKWLSPSGVNIYMSLLLRPGISCRDAWFFTFLASVAAASAIRNLTGLNVKIKWPNDIMFEAKKLGGILLEMRSKQGNVLFVVIGMGINVNQGRFPPVLKNTATSIFKETGERQNKTALTAEILKEVHRRLNVSNKADMAQLLNTWRTLSSTLGQPVKIITGRKPLRGIAKDIDDNGNLIVRTMEGALKKISSGDVEMLRLDV